MEKSKTLVFIIIGILFTTVIAVTVALVFTFSSLKSITNGNGQEVLAQEAHRQDDIEIFSITEPITANLIQDNDDEGKHMLRISVGVGMDTKQKNYKKLKEQLENKISVLRHTIIKVIRNKTYEEMLQPNAQELMGQEILNELKEEFQTDAMVNIYFGEFFVQ